MATFAPRWNVCFLLLNAGFGMDLTSSPTVSSCHQPSCPRWRQAIRIAWMWITLPCQPLFAFFFFVLGEKQTTSSKRLKTNQRKLGFQALSRCYSPTVYFQKSLGNRCHFSLRSTEKSNTAVVSMIYICFLPVGSKAQSPSSNPDSPWLSGRGFPSSLMCLPWAWPESGPCWWPWLRRWWRWSEPFCL